MNLSLRDDATSAQEKQRFWEESGWRRLRAWKAVKFLLEIVLGAWAIYNTVRYFIAYSIYSSREGQAVALALGSVSAVCFASIMCEAALAASQPELIAAQLPSQTSLLLRTIILSLGSFFLLASSVVNLALTIVWRHSALRELDIDSRCRLDVDVVWSISSSTSMCSGANWTAWLSLAVFRIAFTFVLSLSLLITASQCQPIRRSSYYTSYRPHYRRRGSGRASSTLVDGATLRSVITPPECRSSSTLTSQSTVIPPLRRSSHSTVGSKKASQYNSNTNIDRHSMPTRTSSTVDRSLSVASHQTANQDNQDMCEDDRQPFTPQDPLARLDPALIQRGLADAIYLSPSSFNASSTRGDHDLNQFIDQFRVLVNQIARETEEAVEYAHPDTYVREVDSDSDTDESDLGSPRSLEFHNPDFPFGFPQIPPRTLGYDEFGQPYPPDEPVRILNGYIRRMPTIESLGSREVVSSIWSHMDSDRAGGLSIHSLSRPSTRGMTEFAGSEPTSQANSLRLNIAAALASSNGVSRPLTSESSAGHSHHSGDRPSTSRSTFSYHSGNAGAVTGSGNLSSPNSTPSSDGFLSLSEEARSAN
ncbi:hypothetical protein WG66_010122 [Moniliophthora roreri]|nr:hypothetical protein WG66_010122 [Moniliophthora roreri]